MEKENVAVERFYVPANAMQFSLFLLDGMK